MDWHRIQTDSGKGLKSGKDTRVIIESGSEIESPSEVQDHIHAQIQFKERDNLPKYQCGSQNLNFRKVQIGMLKLNLVFQNNMILES